MSPRWRKALVLALKLGVAVVLLWLVLRKVQWEDFTQTVNGREVAYRGFCSTVASADWRLLALSVAAFLAPLFMLSVRWWYLLRIQQIHISFIESVRLTLLGQFFSYVLPGTVSGDVVKAYYVSRHTDRKAAALVSVFVDRAVGLLEFALLPAAVMAVMAAAGADLSSMRWPAAVVGVVLLAVAGGMGVLLSPRLRAMLRLGRLLSFGRLRQHVEVAAEAANLYRRRIGALLKTLGITFGGQAFFITGVMLAGLSLHLPVPWHQYFLYVPLIYIVAAVPISPGGWGVAEISFGLCFRRFFPDPEAAASPLLALALVARLIPMLLSLPGLAVALRGPRMPSAEMQASGFGLGASGPAPDAQDSQAQA